LPERLAASALKTEYTAYTFGALSPASPQPIKRLS
jgi:hypothetical protein